MDGNALQEWLLDLQESLDCITQSRAVLECGLVQTKSKTHDLVLKALRKCWCMTASERVRGNGAVGGCKLVQFPTQIDTNTTVSCLFLYISVITTCSDYCLEAKVIKESDTDWTIQTYKNNWP